MVAVVGAAWSMQRSIWNVVAAMRVFVEGVSPFSVGSRGPAHMVVMFPCVRYCQEINLEDDVPATGTPLMESTGVEG